MDPRLAIQLLERMAAILRNEDHQPEQKMIALMAWHDTARIVIESYLPQEAKSR